MKLRLSSLRWPLTAATAGVAVLWVGSMFAEGWWMNRSWQAVVRSGQASFGHWTLPNPKTPSSPGFQYTGWLGWSWMRVWPDWKLDHPRFNWVDIPLWMPLVVTGVFTSRAWRSHRARTTAADRARTGACPRCGYAREGLAPTAPCPECAHAPPPPP